MLFEKPWEHATVDSQPHNHGTTEHSAFCLSVLKDMFRVQEAPTTNLYIGLYVF
jgi:hypothetical protein